MPSMTTDERINALEDQNRRLREDLQKLREGTNDNFRLMQRKLDALVKRGSGLASGVDISEILKNAGKKP